MPHPDDQLPAIIDPLPPSPAATPSGTYTVPALITDAGGERAGWRYVEFFTANINNDHTRRAYAPACSRFFPGANIAGATEHPRLQWRRLLDDRCDANLAAAP
jgi:hypothetical protein